MTCPASCHDPDCRLTYREHLVGIGIAAAATPTRRAGTNWSATVERQGEKDRRAYKTMRDQGYQPPHVDGAHLTAQAARTEAEIRPLGEAFFEKHRKVTPS